MLLLNKDSDGYSITSNHTNALYSNTLNSLTVSLLVCSAAGQVMINVNVSS